MVRKKFQDQVDGVPFQVCPHPDCTQPLREWVTNAHCEQEHGMTKKELVEKYGEIQDRLIKYK